MPGNMAKAFRDLSEQEILALAIASEDEDGRIYGEFADRLRSGYPASAEVFKKMMAEEDVHRRMLIDMYRSRFGDHIPLIRRQDVKGFIKRKPVWLTRPLGLDAMRKRAASMEFETQRFYERAAARSQDAQIRKLLGDLAEIERQHERRADELEKEHLTPDARGEEDETKRRMFVMQIVQPGLAGLMDGSVSTLAPLFAIAFATHRSHDAFITGLAASVGAGISMGFAEALSDDGVLSGRGKPFLRGVVCGAMTTAGGLGHTLPFLVRDFHWATRIAVAIVVVELFTISWIRQKYMDTPVWSATLQVLLGGALVFAAGVLIGKYVPGAGL
jgi:rubrerythrin